MISLDEALALLRSIDPVVRRETIPVDHAVGTVLARSVHASTDQPPFDRATMDGYAFLPTGEARLVLCGSVHAGQTFARDLAPGEAVAIMTGAPVPSGASVVPVERARREAAAITIEPGFDLKSRHNVAPRGEDAHAGDLILAEGTRLAPATLAAAAMAGARSLEVFSAPRLGILTTGDEVGQEGPSGIADSNGPMLMGLATSLGLSMERRHAPDDSRAIEEALGRLTESNEVTVSVGGVSMGQKDLVPACAAALGFEPLLHKVAIQPGKPVFLAARKDGRVFLGLPGNPVSVLVTAHLFLLPLLGLFLGGWQPRWSSLPLARPWRHNGDRRLFLPARLTPAGLEPVLWNGSGDLYAAAAADGMVDLAPGGTWPSGARLRFLPWFGQNFGETGRLPERANQGPHC